MRKIGTPIPRSTTLAILAGQWFIRLLPLLALLGVVLGRVLLMPLFVSATQRDGHATRAPRQASELPSIVPTLLRHGPCRFYFYSGDRDEPPHVHAGRDQDEAKFWVNPVRLAWSRGFAGPELRKIEAIVVENSQAILDSWNAFFSG